jgi:hypothetical protein
MWRIPIGGGLYGANPTADRFLAASDRFVYALDGVGRLIVIDRRRGVTRGWMEKTDLRVPIVNQVSDRIHLAANDGTIVCMHDRELLKPLRHRKKLEDAASAILKLLDTSVVEKAWCARNTRQRIGRPTHSLRGQLHLRLRTTKRSWLV